MYRIRFHGRGGQGLKTASRILGTAFFLEGYEVQDAPRYGAERRGAPIFAYVRAARATINERGIITRPDLIILADDSLLAMPGAGVLDGCTEQTVLLLHSREQTNVWQERLNLVSPIFTLPKLTGTEPRYLGAACAGGAARLLGMIGQEALIEAINREIAPLGQEKVAASLAVAQKSYDALAGQAGLVREGNVVPAKGYKSPDWINLPFENARLSAPAIHAAATSENSKTGLWRTERPIIDYERCNRCWWICSTYCPEGAIQIDEERRPQIDYDHCKGCMVCLAQCPAHAIATRPEHEATKAGGSNS